MHSPSHFPWISESTQDGYKDPTYADSASTPRAAFSPGTDAPAMTTSPAATAATYTTVAGSAASSARGSPMSQLYALKTQVTITERVVRGGSPSQLAYPSPSAFPRSSLAERSMSDRMSERSPSPQTRMPNAGSMAEALSSSRSPGLIRRMSRGAQNRLRRRASTTQSLRLRDQSAGPVLMRRRSDSNGASDYGQDVSDLDLDSTTDDVMEEPLYPTQATDNALGLGIGAERISHDSANFEGGQAPADPTILHKGTTLLKLTKKKRKSMKFWLDSNSARVCWHLYNPSKSFFVDDVSRVDVGSESRNARDDVQVSSEEERLLLTIVYSVPARSKGRTIKTMHLLMPDMPIMNLWRNALNSVARERAAKMNALSPSSDKSEKSMSILWQQIMAGRAQADQLFHFEDAKRLCRTLQINCSENTVLSHFMKVDTDRTGLLIYAKYRDFVLSFRTRADIQHLYRNITHGTSLDMDLIDFLRFLKDDQGIDVEKDRPYWETVFDKFAKPRTASPTAVATTVQKTLNVKGFQNFLTSSYNSPLISSKPEVTLDRPLNEYFISSSHNTYLLGRQWGGASSVEGYISALIKGCRCIEIDCWDGDNGRPMVTHGRTMTTKVPFEDCVSVIGKYAFHSSPYPLIVSLEVHCNADQQSTMVDLMCKHWDGMMVIEPILNTNFSLPSPEELKHRILVKVKSADYAEQSQLFADTSNGRTRARSLGSAFMRSPSIDKQAILSSPLLSSPATSSPAEPAACSMSTPRGSTTSGPTLSPSSSADDSDEVPASAEKLRKRKTSKIVPRLGQLGVYAQGIKYNGFGDMLAKTYNHIFSFSEFTFDKVCKKDPDSKAQLEKHNTRYLMRVYPAPRRVDSSNFNPLQAWRRGVQMAALNWQTYDVHQQVNEAMFAAGSDSLGYVLKPEELRHAKHVPIMDAVAGAEEGKEKKDKKTVKFTVDIISAQRLPRPWNQNIEAGMNPYIEFEMYSAEDKAPGIAVGEGGVDASARDGSSGIGQPLRKRTKLVVGNGFDPSFNETISMTVHTKYPSLIFVRWTVWNMQDPRKMSPSNVLLATFTAKLSTLQQGYRHLPLFNPHGEQYQDAKLFVKIRKEAPVPQQQHDHVNGVAETASFRSDTSRADRSWPRRIFSRNPSERRRNEQSSNDRQGLLSRTSSMDRASTRSIV